MSSTTEELNMQSALPTSVSFDEATNLIATCGTTNTFVFQGEPGIGKSAMLKSVAKLTDLEPRYVDCALLDLGDLQMPKVTDSLEFVPNKLFTGDDSGKPIIVMLDEIGKAMRPVQNALLTLLLEKRVGSHYLPKGSVVFATTNLATDGVGDKMEAHAKNRVSFLTMRKPNWEEWMNWGAANGMQPEIMAWVKEYPHCLQSYTDYDSADKVENPYIFNPRVQQSAFVSPRSLAHASHIIEKRNKLGDDVLMVALSGTVGTSAAADLQTFLNVADSTTPFKVCVEKPNDAPVPTDPIAIVIMALGAVLRINNDNVNNWMTYLQRLPKETQFLFAQNGMRSNNDMVLARSSEFTKWAVANSWAL
jgi:hypothetical protein